MATLKRAGNALTAQDQADIRRDIGLGTAATLNAPASGAAASGEAVKGNDPRLADARMPTAHSHVLADLPGTVETTTGAQAKADTAQANAIAAAAADATTKANAAAASSIPLAQKGAANGVATLDGTGKVPSAQLPGFVDDVLECANAAALPATGSAGILYVTLDNNRTWRWGGSAYVEISPSPGSTDAVPEGSVNQYHTAARVRAVLLAGLDTGTAAAVTAADSILSAIGKLVALLAGKVDSSDARLSDAREWIAGTIAQTEAEEGMATTRRAWTAERVRQAIVAWWTALPLAPSKVTMSTARLLGRTTAGSGGAEEIAVGSGLTLNAGTLSATGGGGSPGGSDGQIQRNSGGAFAGSNVSQDSSGRVTVAAGTQTTAGSALTLNYTANNSGAAINGLDIQTTDTASAAASRPIRLRTGAAGATESFSVDKNGLLRSLGGYAHTNGSGIYYFGDGYSPKLAYAGQYSLELANGRVTLGQLFGNGVRLAFSSGNIPANDSNAAVDLAIRRISAGVLQVEDGTGSFRDINLRNLIAEQLIQTKALTVATLPAAASWPGGEAYVTDANSPTVGSTVASGGSGKARVGSNGTNWIVTSVI